MIRRWFTPLGLLATVLIVAGLTVGLSHFYTFQNTQQPLMLAMTIFLFGALIDVVLYRWRKGRWPSSEDG